MPHCCGDGARGTESYVVRQFHFLFGLNLMNLLLFAIFVISGLALRFTARISQAADVDGGADFSASPQ